MAGMVATLRGLAEDGQGLSAFGTFRLIVLVSSKGGAEIQWSGATEAAGRWLPELLSTTEAGRQSMCSPDGWGGIWTTLLTHPETAPCLP